MFLFCRVTMPPVSWNSPSSRWTEGLYQTILGYSGCRAGKPRCLHTRERT
jgi:hypothetical protein